MYGCASSLGFLYTITLRSTDNRT